MLSASLVIPVYKSYNLLQRLLASSACPRNASKVRWDIIFVDDSPECNFDWEIFIETLNLTNLQFSSYVVIKNMKNRGVTFSRNRGYLLSCADFVVFFDSDDTFSKDGFLHLEKELLELKPNFSTLLLSTDDIRLNKLEFSSEDFTALLEDYNHGERLVVVRKTGNAKPFIGIFRGHELAGLLRFQSKTCLGVKISSTLIRNYLCDNPFSISSGRQLKLRMRFILQGHFFTGKFLLRRKRVVQAFRFYLAGFFTLFKMLLIKG